MSHNISDQLLLNSNNPQFFQMRLSWCRNSINYHEMVVSQSSAHKFPIPIPSIHKVIKVPLKLLYKVPRWPLANEQQILHLSTTRCCISLLLPLTPYPAINNIKPTNAFRELIPANAHGGTTFTSFTFSPWGRQSPDRQTNGSHRNI